MEQDMLSEESSKEEVAEFLSKKCTINDKAKYNFVNEDITGDILLDLSPKEFRSLNVKLGPLVKIKKFIKENKDKFKEKKINEKITIKSNSDEVKSFFENNLNFKEELDNMDGKTLLEMDEEGMEKLGLNLGQRKKLIKYIAYFKTLKPEEKEEKEEKEDKIIDSNEQGNNNTTLSQITSQLQNIILLLNKQVNKKYEIKNYDNGKYEGDFINGKREGKGIFHFQNGDRYEGDFKNDKMEGKGILYYNNGDIFQGDWRNDKRDGKGIMYYNDGSREMGDFINDQPKGKHAYMDIDKNLSTKNY